LLTFLVTEQASGCIYKCKYIISMPKKPQDQNRAERLNSVSAMLREFRFTYGYTQEQLGELINKSRQSISRSENSKNISLSFLFDIIDTYDITLEEFFSGME
jgi:DNA-binding XRE family transcriptional regulator